MKSASLRVGAAPVGPVRHGVGPPGVRELQAGALVQDAERPLELRDPPVGDPAGVDLPADRAGARVPPHARNEPAPVRGATPRGAYAGTTDRSKPDDVAPRWVSVAGAATRRSPRRYQSVGTGIEKAPVASVAVRPSGVQPSGVRSSRSTGRPGVPDATPDTENPAPSATSPTLGVTWVRVVGSGDSPSPRWAPRGGPRRGQWAADAGTADAAPNGTRQDTVRRTVPRGPASFNAIVSSPGYERRRPRCLRESCIGAGRVGLDTRSVEPGGTRRGPPLPVGSEGPRSSSAVQPVTAAG